MLECSRSVNNVYLFNPARAIALLNSMTSLNVTEILNSVRQLLNELGNGTANLANAHPEVFDDPELKAQVEAFRSTYEEARERLENPTLSIATLGTTSSGKSTIVNALIGRRIAPILNTEMSGGILRLRVSDGSRLVIEETENTYWETGEWSGLSDDDLYSRIQNAMLSYHEIRKKETNCLAPQITNYGALLPAGDRALLDLPAGIDIEIIDLPGLKSVQDRANLQVIQPQVRKSCSLVALDYGQVDEEKRERLLEELKEVVTALNGRTDSMIFVLNRVDMRGADDFPLEQQIERLQREIQSVLSLKTPPDVIPFCARLLYYAQCAWGTRNGDLSSQVDQETRLKLLKSIFEDCAGIIKQSIRGNKELRRWFRGIEDDVDDGEAIDDETMREILRYALEWSGGKQLWDTLRQRVQDAFPQLVVVPILNPVVLSFDVLETQIRLKAENLKEEKKEEIKKQSENLRNKQNLIGKDVQKIFRDFKYGIICIMKKLEENQPASRDEAIDIAENMGIQGFTTLRDTVDTIYDNLNLDCIQPIENALEEQRSAFDLRDKLKEKIPIAYADDIARNYEIIVKISKRFDHNENLRHFYGSVRSDDTKGINELEQVEEAYKKLYTVMRDVLTQQVELNVQAQCVVIKETVQSFVEDLKSYVLYKVDEIFPTLVEALEAEFNQIVSNEPTLPEAFFDFSTDTIEVDTNIKEEKTGTETVLETYTKTIFFFFKVKDTRSVKKDVYGNIEYQELKVPDFYAMPDQWRTGMESRKAELWQVFSTWIVNHLQKVNDEFGDAVDRVIKLTERTLQERLKMDDEEFEKVKQYLLNIESQTDSLVQIRQQLTQQIILEEKDSE
jgi:GTPase SAR1 family protein